MTPAPEAGSPASWPGLRSVAIGGGVVAVWWLGVTLLRVPVYLLPPPGMVAGKLVFLATDAGLARHVLATVTEIALGFGIGAVAGLGVGAVLVRMPRLERLLAPFILLLQTAPKIALAPLLLLWLGLGLAPKVVLIAIVVFFPVMTGAMAGLAGVDANYHALARLLQLSPWTRFIRIEMPFAGPGIFAGLRIASTHAVTAAVVGELIGTSSGLGYLLSLGQENNDPAVVLATIILLSAIGWSFHEVIYRIEKNITFKK